MKKLIGMIALAAISFGSVYANGITVKPVKSTMQTDTTKKAKKKMKKDSISKDTSKHM